MRAKFNRRMTALAVAAALSFSTSVLADTGGLRISILDNTGKPVVGAMVKVRTPDSLTEKEGITDAEGFVRLVGLDPSTKYEVMISGEGYQPLTRNDVRVVSGKSFTLNYTLASNSASVSDVEKIEVTGRTLATLDTTSSSVGVDITLDMTESLPTARTYQGYLQLAPGTKPSVGGNPSSKSGVNYSDAVDSKGNTSGSSSDNVYYIDGINVTDGHTGTHGANFNSEIIQEQQVLTGGIPAEYAGGAGLISRVVTKSGSNEFHGSINYYLQNDSLVSDNKHLPNKGFSTYDTAFTLGGPIIKDKLWFFTSYQVKNREEDVSDKDGNLLRTVTTDQDLGFAKITWQATDSDRLVATYFNDPYEKDGSDDETVPNNRDSRRDQGGDNYKLEYSHSWDDVIFTANYYKHEGELTTSAASDETRNDVAYLGGNPTNAELSRGGLGSNTIQFRNREEFNLNLEYFLYTDFGEHAIKFGYTGTTNERKLDSTYTGSEQAQYTSIAGANSGVTFNDYVSGSWTGATDLVSDDWERIVDGIADSANSAALMAVVDTNNDGVVSEAEVGDIVFNSTAGNPHGLVNAYRIVMTETAPVTYESKGQTWFVQDNWTYENFTVSAGIRAEKWDHHATDGSKIYTFDWEYAPRLSVVYDINGDGDSKVWGFVGRYYDPIRTDMTSFAGTLTGPVREEQIFIDNQWVTFRTRGGSQVQDAFFSPTTKTPYTDEILLGYARTIGDDMSLSFTYTDRKTKDILEDYDLSLYSETLKDTEFYLPYSYFGYDSKPDSNYVIGTLAGGKREYKGYEVTFRKLRADNWQMLASYTYNDAKGNTNSDGNADFQGDVVWLDPRAPGMWGKQPGNIEHLFKVAGSYFWDNGLELGIVYNWNSGMRYSETFSASGRHLPVRVTDAYEYGGVTSRWVADGSVGSHVAGSYGTLDMRLKYSYDFDQYKAEFFLDVFNILDDQAATSEMDLQAGDGVYNFGEARAWVEPRRLYLGARLSF